MLKVGYNARNNALMVRAATLAMPEHVWKSSSRGHQLQTRRLWLSQLIPYCSILRIQRIRCGWLEAIKQELSMMNRIVRLSRMKRVATSTIRVKVIVSIQNWTSNPMQIQKRIRRTKNWFFWVDRSWSRSASSSGLRAHILQMRFRNCINNSAIRT